MYNFFPFIQSIQNLYLSNSMHLYKIIVHLIIYFSKRVYYNDIQMWISKRIAECLNIIEVLK